MTPREHLDRIDAAVGAFAAEYGGATPFDAPTIHIHTWNGQGNAALLPAMRADDASGGPLSGHLTLKAKHIIIVAFYNPTAAERAAALRAEADRIDAATEPADSKVTR